jgi:hypothetical protein
MLYSKPRSFLFMLMLPVFFALAATPPSRAQTEETRALTQEILGLYAATSRLDELTRVTERISYVESVALLSFQGAWKDEKGNWSDELEPPFFYDVFKLQERFGPEVIQIRRAVERDKTIGVNEKKAFRSILSDVQAMLDESRSFYDLLHQGKMDEANSFYRDRTRERYTSIQNASYTLGLALDGRIKKAGLKVRLMK